MSALATFEERAIASGRRLGDHFGQDLILTKHHTLYATIESLVPAALELRTAAALGATAVNLHYTIVQTLPTGGSQPLDGELPAGMLLTIDGAEYTVQSEVAVGEDHRLDGVVISPALASDQMVGALAHLGDGVRITYTGCTIDRYRTYEIDGELILASDLRVTIPKEGADIAPPVGAHIRTAEGYVGEVIGLPQSLPAEWVVQAGSRRAGIGG